MFDIRDLILNSNCITMDNYDLIDNGKYYLPLLKLYNRVYVTSDLCFSGMNAIELDEYFFKSNEKTPSWWNKKLCYSFSMVIVENNDKLELIDLTIKTHNFASPEMIIKFDLMKIKENLMTKDITKKDVLINSFIDSILVYEYGEFIPYTGDYALNLISRNDFSIDVFSSLVLASRVPLLMGIAYLDKVLTEGFKIFLTEFLGMFLETPFKN